MFSGHHLASYVVVKERLRVHRHTYEAFLSDLTVLIGRAIHEFVTPRQRIVIGIAHSHPRVQCFCGAGASSRRRDKAAPETAKCNPSRQG